MAAEPKPLKVGLVIDTSLDPSDGVQQYVIALGEWLTAQGHEVHYLAGETKRRQLPNLHSLSRNIAVRFNGNRTTIPLLASRRKLGRFLRSNHFDILHVQSPHHPLMAQRLIMKADPNTAVIGTFHVLPFGWSSRVGNRLLGLWLRPSLKRFDKMLAVSPAAAAWCRASFGLPAEVLPNVVDYGRFSQARDFERYNDGKLNILFLGRLVPRKGCQVLLEAVAELVKEGVKLPAFRVIICGRGPLEAGLRQFVADNGLEQIVEFAGYIDEADKPRYYASAGIAAFPSRGGESFGIVLIEAMAGGRAAVLAGDNPGYRSVVGTQPELLFKPNSPGELAGKLADLMTDTKKRERLATWGAETAKQYDLSVVGPKLVEIYREALRKRQQL